MPLSLRLATLSVGVVTYSFARSYVALPFPLDVLVFLFACIRYRVLTTMASTVDIRTITDSIVFDDILMTMQFVALYYARAKCALQCDGGLKSFSHACTNATS